MTEPKFKNNVLLFTEIIIPDLKQKPELREAVYANFNQIVNNLEYQAASKIKLLVSVIEILSLVYYFKTFHKLTYQKRKFFIDRLFQFPIGKIVAGITGLRSLVLISYYGLDEVCSQIKNKSTK